MKSEPRIMRVFIGILIGVLLLTSLPTFSQTGDIAVGEGDILTYVWGEINDPSNFLTMLGQSVSSGDEFTFEITGQLSNNIIPSLLSFKGLSSPYDIEVDLFDIVTIPDWDYWNNLVSSDPDVTLTESDTIIIEIEGSDSGINYLVSIEYSLDGIMLSLSETDTNDSGDLLLSYTYEFVSLQEGFSFDGAYGVERGDVFKYKISLFDTDQNLPFFTSENDEMYLFEGDTFTIEIGTTPNNDDQLLLRVEANGESLTFLNQMDVILSFVIYTDFGQWLDLLQAVEDGLVSGEFIEYELDGDLMVYYLYNGNGVYLEYEVVYNSDGVLKKMEYHYSDDNGFVDLLVEIVKSGGDRKGPIPSISILFGLSAIVILRKSIEKKKRILT